MKGFGVPALFLAASLALAGCGAVYPPGATSSSVPSEAVPGTVGTPAPSSASSSPSGGGVPAAAVARVTQADNGKTVTLHVGDTFLLALGDQQWSVAVADPSVVARVPNIMVVRGAQGVYRALKVGTTSLSATGKPACGAGQVCPMYVVGFHVTVQVVAG